jgi:glycosyltransferase involved in cell wall biosynthesis
MKLALVSAPPRRSAAGDMISAVLTAVAGRCDLHWFGANDVAGRTPLAFGARECRSVSELRPREFDQVVYVVCDSAEAGFLSPVLRAFGGTVWLHDWQLPSLARSAWPELARPGWRACVRAWREGGWDDARRWRSSPSPGAGASEAAVLNRSVVRFGDAFLVHFRRLRQRILDDRNAPTPVSVLPYPCEAAGEMPPVPDRRALRGERLPDATWRESFLIGGADTWEGAAAAPFLLEAIARARRARPDVRAVLIGGSSSAVAALRERARTLGLDTVLHATGPLPAEEARAWLKACDLIVQLRGASLAEATAGVYRALALGRAVLATAADEQAELPDECVYKIAPGADALERLAGRIVELRDAPSVRTAMESAARAVAARAPSCADLASTLLDELAGLPLPRAARKSLIALRLGRELSSGYRRGRDGGEPPDRPLSR